MTAPEHINQIMVNGIPTRHLMGVDEEGNSHVLKCDTDGYLLVKAVPIDASELEDE